MDEYYKLQRDWQTPFTNFSEGHILNSETWAKIFGISQINFYEYLAQGTFKDWLRREF